MRLISIIALTLIYGFTLLVSFLGGLLRSGSKGLNNKIIINGTFHNPNWFNAHIVPIVESGFGEVILITDEVIYELDNLKYSCPPALLNKVLTRAGAKFVWTLKEAFKHKASIHIGYHIFPSAVTALIAARMTGARCCYQVTSGPLELEGGGYDAENRLLVGLGKPSRLVEHMAHSVVKRFDLVVVRGSKAEAYVRSAGYESKIEVVTGSVITDQTYACDEREIDVIFVGRLTEYKRPDIFFSLMKDLAEKVPEVKIKVVGDGPMSNELKQYTEVNSLTSNIEFLGKRKDVLQLLGNSKVFVLTSRWEGVSIAMLEAMALGVVPVVVDVGDLSDYVKNDETGYIYDHNNVDKIPDKIRELLNNPNSLEQYSKNAKKYVADRCDRGVLSKRWRGIFNTMVEPAA